MLKIGEWLLEPDSRRAIRGEQEHRLSPKAVGVLLALAETPGRVWSRNALLERVWPDVTVGEEVLTHAVAEVRRAFEDSAREARLLETVHKAGYRLLCPVERAGPTTVAASVAPATPPAVAVLPFENLGDDPDQAYFADGLTEELITALQRWRWFPVIARGSAFAYRSPQTDCVAVAEALGARYLVQGGVRRAADRVRVTARLVDGRSGRQLWAERFERVLGDIFALQDELTRRIAFTIGPEIGRAEIEAVRARPAPDLNAWDLQLRAQARLWEFTAEGNAAARELAGQAVALEPGYAEAWATLATTYTRDVLIHWGGDKADWLARALEAARRAVLCDPLSADARGVLSTVYTWLEDADQALAEARTAVELNPYDAVILHALGNKSDLAGDPAGLGHMLEAERLNPQDPFRHSHSCFLARALANAGRLEEAEARARLAVRLRPDYPHGHFILAVVLGLQGREAEGGEALARCAELDRQFVADRAHWRPYAEDVRNAPLRNALQRVGIERLKVAHQA
jgi:adenylate cyclase